MATDVCVRTVWEWLKPTFDAVYDAKPAHYSKQQIFLERNGYLEECFFTWSMVPRFNEHGQVLGMESECPISKCPFDAHHFTVPNFEDTSAVVNERRIRLLREASQAWSFNTTPASLFRRVCRATVNNPIDLPLAVFYDCSFASDEAEDDSHRSTNEASILQGTQTHSDHGMPAGTPDLRGTAQALASEEAQRPKPTLSFVRAAMAGAKDSSKVFPKEIAAPNEDDTEPAIATHPDFLKFFRQVQRTHKQVVLYKSDIAGFVDHLDKTSLGDQLSCLVIIPLLTSDDTLRAIAVVGLNPRKAYGDDYQVFLDLFQSQVSHGVTSIRLVNEELRR